MLHLTLFYHNTILKNFLQESFSDKNNKMGVESRQQKNVTVVTNVKRAKGIKMSKSMRTGIYGVFAVRLTRTLAMVYLAYFILKVM